jgi:hypothetical protein
MLACPILAPIVKQSLADIFPNGVRSIQQDRVRLLNFHSSSAPQALDAQKVARDFRKATLLDRQRWSSSGARIGQDGIP